MLMIYLLKEMEAQFMRNTLKMVRMDPMLIMYIIPMINVS